MNPSAPHSPLHSGSGGSELDFVHQFSFLDVSLEDDSLLPPGSKEEVKSSSNDLLDASLSVVVEPVPSIHEDRVENQQEAACESLTEQSGDVLGPLLTKEPALRNKTKKNGVNLRKSLAWNNAFLTEEGVLDSEELSLVNRTFQKKVPQQPKLSCYRQLSKVPKMLNPVIIPKSNPTSIPSHKAITNIDAQSIPRMQAGNSPRSSVESLASTETKRAECIPNSGNGSTGVRRGARKPPTILTVQSDLEKQEKPVTEVSEEHCQKKKRMNMNNVAPDLLTSVHSQLPTKSTSGRQRSQDVSITAAKRHSSGVTMAPAHGEKSGTMCKDRPSGLRLPSPKLGFFDTSRISSETAISRIGGTNKSDVDGNSGKRHSGLRRPGAASLRSKHVTDASGVNNKSAVNDASSNIPSAPHRRSADIPAPGSTRSIAPVSRKVDDDIAQVLQAKNTVKNVCVRGKFTGIRSALDGSGQENSHPECLSGNKLK